MPSNRPSDRVGVYCIGARGAIGVAVLAGAAVLEEGAVATGGMISDHPPFRDLPFTPWDRWVFGGCDVTDVPLVKVLESHLRAGIAPGADRPIVRDYLAAAEERIDDVSAVAPPAVNGSGEATGLDVVQGLRSNLSRFVRHHGLDRLLVVSCCSTEPWTETCAALQGPRHWDGLRQVLSMPAADLPWGPLYAAAALLEGCAFVNFTPNLGTDLPALADLARQRRLPHAGKDGKTGETLLKSVLAPMFDERDLEVLAWQGYNILGNNDGRSLSDPRARAAKVASKDRQLGALLPRSRDLHTHVGIDYVPSLGDWKTAWDFVHFRGFLGARMSFQFVWNGCDTALATPLVLELARFTELAWRQGEWGHLSHLDAYFKSPAGSDDHDFRRQMQRLRDHFARPHRTPEAATTGDPPGAEVAPPRPSTVAAVAASHRSGDPSRRS